MILEKYYTEMGAKNEEGLAPYLSEEVHFKSPMSEFSSKEEVLSAASGFMNAFESLEIKHSFENAEGYQMVVLLLHTSSNQMMKACTIAKVEDDLIIAMELFFDPAAFK